MSIPGTKTMLFGPPGSGKTHSIRTLLDAGLEVFCQFTEPSGTSVLGDTDPEKLHWNYVAPANPGLGALAKMVENINKYDQSALMKLTDPNKAKYNQAFELLSNLVNFKCLRTGKTYGDVTQWGTNRALVLDSLSGLNIMFMDNAVGGRPIKQMADWGIAIDNLERFLNQLTLGMNAHFILIAHSERQTDELMGGVKVLPSTLGKKLPTLLGRFFDDIVYTQLVGTEFQWSTMTANVDSKARNLKIASKLPPTFVPIIENWKKMGGVISQPLKETENV